MTIKLSKKCKEAMQLSKPISYTQYDRDTFTQSWYDTGRQIQKAIDTYAKETKESKQQFFK
jgi:hypothetical protein